MTSRAALANVRAMHSRRCSEINITGIWGGCDMTSTELHRVGGRGMVVARGGRGFFLSCFPRGGERRSPRAL